MKNILHFLAMLCAMALLFSGCSRNGDDVKEAVSSQTEILEEDITGQEQSNIIGEENNQNETYSLADIPDFSGKAYIEINGGQPNFSENDKHITDAFEYYSELDKLGRCGIAYANVCQEIMPTEKRGSIGKIKPSGWHTVKYNNLIDGNYLYNRCHLIGYQLAGENANEKNLITGTRYLNVEGMLPFEDKVAEYAAASGNHVLYRVTPVFDGQNLLASGVEIEAWSVEDNGTGICFHIYCYNVQPGIEINYADGASREADSYDISQKIREYVLNTNTKRIHLPDCSSINDMSKRNKKKYTGTIRSLKEEGYIPCGNCLAEYRA